jgi:FkbM family methyltransferase
MPEFVELSKTHCNDINTIFEIGSMDGNDSLLFKQSFPNAEVYAFEGLPDNYNLYMKDLNGVHTFNKIIFNYDGKITFYKKEINGIHSVFDRGSAYGTETMNLYCYRLDTICKELNIDHIDMMKIDVEGATLEVLEGMGDILKTVKIMHIETEDYPFFKGQKLDNEVTKFLLDNGFTVLKKSRCVLTAGNYQLDSVWIGA